MWRRRDSLMLRLRRERCRAVERRECLVREWLRTRAWGGLCRHRYKLCVVWGRFFWLRGPGARRRLRDRRIVAMRSARTRVAQKREERSRVGLNLGLRVASTIWRA